jgi:molybdopterin synthase sulfur carrier subunit
MARILLFGKLAEIAGWRRRDIVLPHDVKTLSGLRAYLADAHPEIGAASTRAAINRHVAHLDDPVTDDDEIAFMPPMSGG